MNVTTDTEIKLQGMEALIAALGEVRAEKFISLIAREPLIIQYGKGSYGLIRA